MAGDININDAFTAQDFKTLKSLGITVIVKLDLTHSPDEKHLHLDIELDFGNVKPDFPTFLSKFKSTSTYLKLHMGAFKPDKKKYTGKYEAAHFGQSVLKDASNKSQIQQALKDFNNGKGKRQMFEIKYG